MNSGNVKIICDFFFIEQARVHISTKFHEINRSVTLAKPRTCNVSILDKNEAPIPTNIEELMDPLKEELFTLFVRTEHAELVCCHHDCPYFPVTESQSFYKDNESSRTKTCPFFCEIGLMSKEEAKEKVQENILLLHCSISRVANGWADTRHQFYEKLKTMKEDC